MFTGYLPLESRVVHRVIYVIFLLINIKLLKSTLDANLNYTITYLGYQQTQRCFEMDKKNAPIYLKSKIA
jgi:hypothetical protein